MGISRQLKEQLPGNGRYLQSSWLGSWLDSIIVLMKVKRKVFSFLRW
jgi:hypothetical protein